MYSRGSAHQFLYLELSCLGVSFSILEVVGNFHCRFVDCVHRATIVVARPSMLWYWQCGWQGPLAYAGLSSNSSIGGDKEQK